MSNVWSTSTHKVYSSSLLAWHVHCDKKAIPELQWALAHHSHITSFITSLAGSYSGSMTTNYLYSLCTWYLLHRIEWKLNAMEMEALLKGASRLSPEQSKWKPRQLYMQDFIAKIKETLNPDNPFDVAVFACLTGCFYSAAHLGEFTAPRLDAFDPCWHMKTSSLCSETNENGMEVTVLHTPQTKAAPIEGEDVFWSC